jgi:peptidoglycan/LPS O-acetylase OafA/YrhL
MFLSAKKRLIKGEIQSVELLRGIASIMVCYFHLTQGNTNFLPATDPVKQSGTWGWTGVEVFFVISGFIIPYSMYVKNYVVKDFPTFLWKRVIRIEPPYIISVAIVILLDYLSTLSPYYRGSAFVPDWGNALGHIAYLNVFTGGTWLNPVYWTLAIEFQYYILMAFCFGILTSSSRILRLGFFAVFAGISFLHVYGDRFIFGHSLFFLAGILVFQLAANIIDRKEFGILIVLLLILMGVTQGAILTAMATIALMVLLWVDKVPRLFRQLGMISYSLYLLHVPIGGRIINIAESKIHNVHLRELVVFVALAVCLAVSWVFYRYVEGLFKRLSSSIKYKPNPVGKVQFEKATT